MRGGSSSIRRLRAADIPASVELSSAAGWNQTAEDWLLLLELQPDGCLALTCDERLVATTTLLCYGDRLAWIGMVLTHPSYRRRGFARQLMEHAIGLAETKRVATVKLDATNQGLPLYESLGFRVEQEIQRWSGASLPNPAATYQKVSWTTLAGLDFEAFGADRSRVLQRLAQGVQPIGNPDGYVMRRAGACASYLGPCVSRTADSARALLQAVLWGGGKPWFWDLLPSNQDAVSLATDLGFKAERRLARMTRGAELRGNDSLVYAAAGFELG